MFIIGVQRQGPREVRQCFLDVSFARERVSEVVVRLHVVGRQFQRAFVAIDRLARSAQLRQRHTRSDQRLDVVPLSRQRVVVLHERVIGPLQPDHHLRERQACLDIVRPQANRLLELVRGLFPSADGCER